MIKRIIILCSLVLIGCSNEKPISEVELIRDTLSDIIRTKLTSGGVDADEAFDKVDAISQKDNGVPYSVVLDNCISGKVIENKYQYTLVNFFYLTHAQVSGETTSDSEENYPTEVIDVALQIIEGCGDGFIRLLIRE